MGFLYSVIGFVIAIGVLVAVHEFGHFWVARKLGVKVLRFSIGFGKPLYQRVFGEDKTEFVIAAVPLGGYVKMLGENDPDAPIQDNERHRAFDNQALWKRSLIVAAGPGINFLFAFVLFFALAMPQSQHLEPVLGNVGNATLLGKEGIGQGDRLVSINGRQVDYLGQYDLYVFNQVLKGNPLAIELITAQGQKRNVVLPTADIPIYNINPNSLVRTIGFFAPSPQIRPELAQIVADSPAARAGLQVADVITHVNGNAIASWQQLVVEIQGSPATAMELTVARDNRSIDVSVTPDAVDGANGKVGRLGVGPVVLPIMDYFSDDQKVIVDHGIGQAVLASAERTWLMSVVTLRMLWKMVTFQVSHKNINGPITMADYAGQAIQIGLDQYLLIIAVISISLGVMNLLPIPMLDGGHLLMYGVEVVAGQRVAQQVFAVGQRLGLLMLLGLMSLAFYNDIFRLLN